MRKSLALLLKSADFHAATYGSAEEFLDHYDAASPGCLILDVRMEGMSGLELQTQLTGRGFRIPIIFISGYTEVPMVVQAVKAGAIDFLEKPFDDERLLQHVEQALERDIQSKQEDAWRAGVEANLAALTPREREIMDFLVAGEHAKRIASKLGISSKTVHVHRAKVLKKMQADSVVELARLLHRLPR